MGGADNLAAQYSACRTMIRDKTKNMINGYPEKYIGNK